MSFMLAEFNSNRLKQFLVLDVIFMFFILYFKCTSHLCYIANVTFIINMINSFIIKLFTRDLKIRKSEFIHRLITNPILIQKLLQSIKNITFALFVKQPTKLNSLFVRIPSINVMTRKFILLVANVVLTSNMKSINYKSKAFQRFFSFSV